MAVALHSGNIEIQEEDDDEEDDDINCDDVESPAQQKHPQKMPQSGRRRYRMLAMGFGLLCGVQALLNIGLRLSLYSELNTEKNNLVKDLDQMQSKYNNLTEQMNQIQSKYNGITKERDDLKRLFESPGWQKSACSYYYVSTEAKTWEESRQYCRDKQSDLMVINSEEKEHFVERVAGTYQYMWLGLTDRDEEGVWTWVDGAPLTTPTYWHLGEPDSVGEEDCIAFWNGDNKGWFDKPCYIAYRWICERVLC